MNDLFFIIGCIATIFDIILLLSTLYSYISFILKRNKDRKLYTVPIQVKCTNVEKIEVKNREHYTVSRNNGNYNDNYYTVITKIQRPTFQGNVNGEVKTFCRKKDLFQPKSKIGESYTLYMKESSINYKDFREENELKKGTEIEFRKKLNLFTLILTIFVILFIITFVYVEINTPSKNEQIRLKIQNYQNSYNLK